MPPLSSAKLMTALGYGLIVAGIVPTLAAFHALTWAIVPVWLMLTGYTASILKSLSTDHDRSKRFGDVVLLAWTSFFAIAVMWPRDVHVHWYDSLVLFSIMAYPDPVVPAALLTAYYALSASSHMQRGEVLQVAGRGILAAVMADQVHHALKVGSEAGDKPPIAPPPSP
jgi:hypothetical protein